MQKGFCDDSWTESGYKGLTYVGAKTAIRLGEAFLFRRESEITLKSSDPFLLVYTTKYASQ